MMSILGQLSALYSNLLNFQKTYVNQPANEITSGLHVTVSTKGISTLLHIDVIDDKSIRDKESASAFFLPERYNISKLYAPKEASHRCHVAFRCAVERT